MDRGEGLHRYLADSAARAPEHVALVDPGIAKVTYAELDQLSDRVRDHLAALGVHRGDRVGLCLRKSIDTVATIFGILKRGAAYVPVDSTAPATRNAYIFNHCAVKAVWVEQQLADGLGAQLSELKASPALVKLDFSTGGLPLEKTLARVDAETPAPATTSAHSAPDDLAYILYTSGSTGKPKGVMLSHRNAISFVDWCTEAFQPAADNVFSSHAPFHFDLSILDLYLPIKHGAALVLVTEQMGKDPGKLASLIAENRITNWYSTPSILSLLAQFGHLDRHDLSQLTTVLFAGEVFPVKHLRDLKQLLPAPRYFNLYGPTETNVCTYYEIPREIPADRTEPFPIGPACSHSQTRVVDESGHDAPRGSEGELWVAGDGVMMGYWNAPDADARVFVKDDKGTRWYRTGDIVIEDAEGSYDFVGRRDRMVKKRGYRIELGEIEAGLYRHPEVKEAAVIALADHDGGVRIKAFLSCHGTRPSIIAMKQFCGEVLPAYMVPDLFSWQEVLPKTSTDKIDYQKLKELD